MVNWFRLHTAWWSVQFSARPSYWETKQCSGNAFFISWHYRCVTIVMLLFTRCTKRRQLLQLWSRLLCLSLIKKTSWHSSLCDLSPQDEHLYAIKSNWFACHSSNARVAACFCNHSHSVSLSLSCSILKIVDIQLLQKHPLDILDCDACDVCA